MPPVETNLFVGASLFRRPFGEVARAIVPTLAITCISLVVLIFVPTISTGLLSWKKGAAIYRPFPWHTPPAEVAGALPSPDAGTPQHEGAKAPLTMEEMMRQANERNATPDAGAPSSSSKKPLTMEEMMRQANEQLGAADAGP